MHLIGTIYRHIHLLINNLRMVHIRQPFFSIATATIFAILGLVLGLGAGEGTEVMLGTYTLSAGAAWALTGLMFLMAYFALVHLKDK
jgi:hypothetical protein